MSEDLEKDRLEDAKLLGPLSEFFKVDRKTARLDSAVDLSINLTSLKKTHLFVPSIRLVEDEFGARLEWQEELDHTETVAGDCLAEFVKLADASDLKIAEFALRWGPLGIRRDGRLAVRPDDRIVSVAEWLTMLQEDNREGSSTLTEPRFNTVDSGWCEPTDCWRAYAQFFRGLLRISFGLSKGNAASDVDVDVVHNTSDVLRYGSTWYAFTPLNEQRVSDWRKTETGPASLRWITEPFFTDINTLVHGFNSFIDLFPWTPGLIPNFAGGARIGLKLENIEKYSDPQSWKRFLRNDNRLATLLLVQLLFSLSGASDLITCSRCKNPFAPQSERAPRQDRSWFCSDGCRNDAKKEMNRVNAAKRRGSAETP